jgi:hypothetical protein
VIASRSWLSAACAVVALAAVELSVVGASGRAAGELHPIAGVERDLARALTRAKTTQLLRFHRHRTKTPNAPVDEVEWVDLSNGQRRVLDYDATGHLTTRTTPPRDMPQARWNPSGACDCDLDPFTNFSREALHVVLVGEQTIDGKPTIHLTFAATAPNVSTTEFWIDRSTHLPVRSKTVYRPASVSQRAPAMTTSDEFTWLPRTRANLAELGRG